MLHELQPDVRKLLEMARKMKYFDATLAAARAAGQPIEPAQAALDERKRMELEMLSVKPKLAMLKNSSPVCLRMRSSASTWTRTVRQQYGERSSPIEENWPHSCGFSLSHNKFSRKTMTEKFYHVLAAIGDRNTGMLFSDLTARELDQQFVAPYKRGKTFFAGATIVNPHELRKVRIIETPVKENEARAQINRASLAEIVEMNRTSGMMVISPGQGYEPEDIAEAGVDATRIFLRGGPGSSNGLLGLSKTAAGWVLTIVASVLAAGLAKMLGWV